MKDQLFHEFVRRSSAKISLGRYSCEKENLISLTFCENKELFVNESDSEKDWEKGEDVLYAKTDDFWRTKPAMVEYFFLGEL